MDLLWLLYRHYMLFIRCDPSFTNSEESFKANFLYNINKPESQWTMESMRFWIRQVKNSSPVQPQFRGKKEKELTDGKH